MSLCSLPLIEKINLVAPFYYQQVKFIFWTNTRKQKVQKGGQSPADTRVLSYYTPPIYSYSIALSCILLKSSLLHLSSGEITMTTKRM